MLFNPQLDPRHVSEKINEAGLMNLKSSASWFFMHGMNNIWDVIESWTGSLLFMSPPGWHGGQNSFEIWLVRQITDHNITFVYQLEGLRQGSFFDNNRLAESRFNVVQLNLMQGKVHLLSNRLVK